MNAEVTCQPTCKAVFGTEVWGGHHSNDCPMHTTNFINALQQQVTELEGKAALADVLLAGDPLVDNAPEAGVGTFSKICRWCGWSGKEPHPMSPAAIHKLPGYGHHPECPKLRYDALTSPSTIAQKEMVQ